jgi:hypothetical protein
MREDGATGTDFQLRTAASKIILDKMTEEEQKILNDAAVDITQNGYSEEHKRRLVLIRFISGSGPERSPGPGPVTLYLSANII